MDRGEWRRDILSEAGERLVVERERPERLRSSQTCPGRPIRSYWVFQSRRPEVPAAF